MNRQSKIEITVPNIIIKSSSQKSTVFMYWLDLHQPSPAITRVNLKIQIFQSSNTLDLIVNFQAYQYIKLTSISDVFLTGNIYNWYTDSWGEEEYLYLHVVTMPQEEMLGRKRAYRLWRWRWMRLQFNYSMVKGIFLILTTIFVFVCSQ